MHETVLSSLTENLAACSCRAEKAAALVASAAGGDGQANAAAEGLRQQLADAAEEQAAVEEELVELREAVKVAEASVQTPFCSLKPHTP